ncbi:aspartic peptidase domain-containing protein [Massariosphaeria phaeospora]|uniref:Aspartic peptidase domain-containing protein n=1 Tax=Massariosphaeria phaeospora TaxID=100035 RepID=A0A7C8MCS0_9PLEO|nr:aspartic peptidase domain-containing protein [Massariosphaeria phaeospora]
MANISISGLPAPVVFSPGGWYSNDGNWSSFNISIGAREQHFSVFPDMFTSELRVPSKDGCSLDDDPSDCGVLRGAWDSNMGFDRTTSPGYYEIGYLATEFAAEMGGQEVAMYGAESVTFYVDTEFVIITNQHLVSEISDKTPFVGLLGLTPEGILIKDGGYWPSTMETLRAMNETPSLSYGYTAGASYKFTSPEGSLIMGGYDASKFQGSSDDVSFPFSASGKNNITVGIQNIISQHGVGEQNTLLNTPIMARIDSSLPHLWLPRYVCDKFESVFGLTYDDDSDLYWINDTMHDQHLTQNPSVNFTLGNEASKTSTISFPYSAFDMKAQWPITGGENIDMKTYFPIRRGKDDNDPTYTYILGRTFLQEAYIIVDYEAGNFSVHQALYPTPKPPEDIVTILPAELRNLPKAESTPDTKNDPNFEPTSTNTPSGKGKRRKFAGGSIAGIVIGLLAAVAILLALLWILRRRKDNAKLHEQKQALTAPDPTLDPYAAAAAAAAASTTPKPAAYSDDNGPPTQYYGPAPTPQPPYADLDNGTAVVKAAHIVRDSVNPPPLYSPYTPVTVVGSGQEERHEMMPQDPAEMDGLARGVLPLVVTGQESHGGFQGPVEVAGLSGQAAFAGPVEVAGSGGQHEMDGNAAWRSGSGR